MFQKSLKRLFNRSCKSTHASGRVLNKYSVIIGSNSLVFILKIVSKHWFRFIKEEWNLTKLLIVIMAKKQEEPDEKIVLIELI
jgi:hypothetical protein